MSTKEWLWGHYRACYEAGLHRLADRWLSAYKRCHDIQQRLKDSQ